MPNSIRDRVQPLETARRQAALNPLVMTASIYPAWELGCDAKTIRAAAVLRPDLYPPVAVEEAAMEEFGRVEIAPILDRALKPGQRPSM